jgi:crossover junction endodeoxyribonuclease RuvC
LGHPENSSPNRFILYLCLVLQRVEISDFDKIVLGIDPGTNIMGYGVVGITGKQHTLISIGVIRLEKLEDHAIKLKYIFERVTGIIDSYKPDELAIEAPFFGKNVQSMLKLGRAQGVAIAAALMREIPIYEYQPRKIKLSVTGSGNASKEQVAAMLQTLLKFDEMPKNLDATDALGAAMCHIFQNSNPRGFGLKTGKKAGSGWEKFVSENKERIK